jgi:hypothetical protein
LKWLGGAGGKGAIEGGKGHKPRENVEGLPDVGVAVPAEHQEEVAEGGEGDGEDNEGFVAARSGHISIKSLLPLLSPVSLHTS